MRDTEVTGILEKNGWMVLRFWEKEIKSDLDEVVEAISSAVRDRSE